MSDFAAQDNASDIAVAWADKTHSFVRNPEVQVQPALTPPYATLMHVYNARIGITSDGVGTKVEVAERVGRWDTLGFDLCAMVADDLAAGGYEPVAITNVLDVDGLDLSVVQQLMSGLHAACSVAGMAVAGGETAELGRRVAGHGPRMHANWSATAVGVLRPDWEVVDGREVQVGDAIVTVRSEGFRSNGFTLARSILSGHFGDDWHLGPCGESTWGDALLRPCDLYAPLVVALRSAGVPLTGLAHITGGGLANKLGRTLRPNKLGATLTAPQSVPHAMLELARLGKVPPEKAFQNWNMGQGFCVVVRQSNSARVLKLAAELGFEAQLSGAVTAERVLRVQSELGTVETSLT